MIRVPANRLAIYIDDGPALPGNYTTSQDMIDVSSNLPRWDPAWQAFDSAGHFHAHDADADAFPTLTSRTEHFECDGSCGILRGGITCEGYDRDVYSCTICGEDIAPGTIPGPHSEKVPGPRAWDVTVTLTVPRLVQHPTASVQALAPYGQKVTVRIDNGQRVIFGVAVVADQQVISVNADDVTVTTRLVGDGDTGITGRDKNRTGE